MRRGRVPCHLWTRAFIFFSIGPVVCALIFFYFLRLTFFFRAHKNPMACGTPCAGSPRRGGTSRDYIIIIIIIITVRQLRSRPSSFFTFPTPLPSPSVIIPIIIFSARTHPNHRRSPPGPLASLVCAHVLIAFARGRLKQLKVRVCTPHR